ncbi:alpha/beta hydrolase fold-domain-containing protein [Chlamydoabsidia padenii]|nr:alpha/beta hydrolase fold-domain-containing protein [Chlamydoabsidia padenii]
MYNPDRLAKVRQQYDDMQPLSPLPDIAPMEYYTIQASLSTVRLVLLRPKHTARQTLPVVVYLHGGGFIFGSFASKEKFIRNVVTKSHVALIYVDYSLSPEARYPVAVEETFSTVLWAYKHANLFAFDRSKISIIGDSAGGCLAAAASILLNRRGYSGILENQILVYPMLTHDRSMFDSDKQFGQGDYLLTSEEMACYSQHYIGDCHATDQDPILAPLHATIEDLKNQPRCLILTAECDVLRDEGEHYARRLAAARVDSCSVRIMGTVHGFMALVDDENSHYRRVLNLISGFLSESHSCTTA